MLAGEGEQLLLQLRLSHRTITLNFCPPCPLFQFLDVRCSKGEMVPSEPRWQLLAIFLRWMGIKSNHYYGLLLVLLPASLNVLLDKVRDCFRNILGCPLPN
jgi:hypothetical protein